MEAIPAAIGVMQAWIGMVGNTEGICAGICLILVIALVLGIRPSLWGHKSETDESSTERPLNVDNAKRNSR
jgi:hypothetical protein